MASPVLGYETPIRKALWERIKHLGAPRMMTYAWMMGAAWLALLAFNKWGIKWSLAVGVLWAVVQGVLALMTWWNPRWDNALCARFERGYQSYYPAG
jgi:hypothetical protein